jgi:hypothetical protein
MVLAVSDLPTALSLSELPGTILGLLLEIVNLHREFDSSLDPRRTFMLELWTLF